jgi:hypothetical protein
VTLSVTSDVVPGEGGRGLCDNCARDDDDLVLVHRVYVTPETWDEAGSETEVAETERWCFSCRSMYPHRVEVEGPGPTPG